MGAGHFRDDRAVGMQHFAATPVGRPTTPDQCIAIEHVFTDAEARGSGVGTALLRHGIAWAREAGYDRCSVDWEPSNLLGSRFWNGNGFRPISYWLTRRLDERIAWTHGRE